ncbi:MAG TPA: MBL fold metallo-hydrolase, partial [Polyangiaceae bacterium LLY-WYZ-15_(1-7)]|nr:MBL fold metallo-hydrolase [Polyangiaceae bacterium LLY-WYZ-15_(1-7)]
VLGSGTAIPHAARGAAGYLVEHAGALLLLDSGPGSTRRWPAMGVDFERVELVVHTHHHVDHCSDLAAILFGRNVARPRVAERLTLVGPVGHAALVAGLDGLFGRGVHAREGDRIVRELGDGDVFEHGPFRIEAVEQAHPRRNPGEGGALGYRVRAGGRTMCFSGDAGPSEALGRLCAGVELALLECSYPAGRETRHHLTTRTAAEAALEGGVGHLVLTHFYPECDAVDVRAEVRAAGWRGPLTLAEDLRWIEV